MVALMTSTAGLSVPVILMDTPPPHGRHSVALPPDPKQTKLWPVTVPVTWASIGTA